MLEGLEAITLMQSFGINSNLDLMMKLLSICKGQLIWSLVNTKNPPKLMAFTNLRVFETLQLCYSFVSIFLDLLMKTVSRLLQMQIFLH